MKDFKLKRIDWYIIKQFLGTYVFAIFLIISISVVFDINEKIDKFLRPEVPLSASISAPIAAAEGGHFRCGKTETSR